jgi:hypothetical protein
MTDNILKGSDRRVCKYGEIPNGKKYTSVIFFSVLHSYGMPVKELSY